MMVTRRNRLTGDTSGQEPRARRRKLSLSARMRRLIGSLCLALIMIVPTLALAGRSPKDPQLQPRAADIKLAKSLLVTRSDLPAGFIDKGAQGSGNGSAGEPGCIPSLHSLAATADVNGHTFDRNGSEDSISSGATFFLTSQQAGTAIAAVSNVKTGRCLKTVLISQLHKSLGNKVTLKVRVVPLAVSSGEFRLTAWDVILTMKAKGRTIGGELLVAFYRRGRVVSNLDISTFGGLTSADAAKLSKAVATRLLQLPASAVR